MSIEYNTTVRCLLQNQRDDLFSKTLVVIRFIYSNIIHCCLRNPVRERSSTANHPVSIKNKYIHCTVGKSLFRLRWCKVG
ncbi:hypothetical protein D3C74_463190 [compost metagenome]